MPAVPTDRRGAGAAGGTPTGGLWMIGLGALADGVADPLVRPDVRHVVADSRYHFRIHDCDSRHAMTFPADASVRSPAPAPDRAGHVRIPDHRARRAVHARQPRAHRRARLHPVLAGGPRGDRRWSSCGTPPGPARAGSAAWPSLCVGVWMLIDADRLLHDRRRATCSRCSWSSWAATWCGGASAARAAPRPADDGQSQFSAFAIMGGVARRSNSQAFQGADLTAVMGGCEIDLRHASIAPGTEAVIEVFAFWGGIEIKVPEDWTVVPRVFPLMGGVDDRTRAPLTLPDKPLQEKRLVVRGIVVMGGVGIKNASPRPKDPETDPACIRFWRGRAAWWRTSRSGCRWACCSPRCSPCRASSAGRDAIVVAVPLAVAYGFLCLSAWYVTGGSPVDRAGALRVGVSAVASSFLSSAVWLLIARGWLGVIGSFGRWPDVAAVFRLAAPTLFGFGFLLYLLAMAASYLAAAFNVSRDAERRGLELQVLAREAELRALRAQIDPHFLFNSLQSISALTTADRGRGAADVPAARGLPARDARARRAQAHSAAERAGAGAPVPRGRAGPVRGAPAGRDRRAGRSRARSPASCRRSCCSRSSRTPSGTASRTSSTAASSGSAWRSG